MGDEREAPYGYPGRWIPAVGCLVGLTVEVLLARYGLPTVVHLPVGVGAAAVAGYGVSVGMGSRVTPAVYATVTTVISLGGGLAAAVLILPRLPAGTAQVVLPAVVVLLVGFGLLRLVGSTVDRFPSTDREYLIGTVSVVAGMVGVVVAAVAIPLFVRSGMTPWAGVGFGAGLGYLEGVVAGVVLRPR